jgi:hypothetical protein
VSTLLFLFVTYFFFVLFLQLHHPNQWLILIEQRTLSKLKPPVSLSPLAHGADDINLFFLVSLSSFLLLVRWAGFIMYFNACIWAWIKANISNQPSTLLQYHSAFVRCCCTFNHVYFYFIFILFIYFIYFHVNQKTAAAGQVMRHHHRVPKQPSLVAFLLYT